MDEEFAPRQRGREPRRIHVPGVTFSKAACGGAAGPESGLKDPDQVVMKAQYRGREIELDMVASARENYTWKALKSKVRL